jgi:hypothetical protein
MSQIAALSVAAPPSKETLSEGKSSDPAKEKAATNYICSMHTELVQDKPSDCPKCGMKLVEKH